MNRSVWIKPILYEKRKLLVLGKTAANVAFQKSDLTNSNCNIFYYHETERHLKVRAGEVRAGEHINSLH